MPGPGLLNSTSFCVVPSVEDPGIADLNPVGVVCVILKLFKLPDGNQSIIVHGLARFRLTTLNQTEPFAIGQIEILEDVALPGTPLDPPRAGMTATTLVGFTTVGICLKLGAQDDDALSGR